MRLPVILPGILIAFLCHPHPAFSASLAPQDIEFFESRIRPVLAQDCYECHASTGKRKGGLALDSRDSLLQGGDSGPVIVAGNPKASLLLRAIRHEDPDLKMPKAGARLEDSVIADFAEWIKKGAPDPREAPPSAETIAQDTDWNAVMERRKRWWSFQPIQPPKLDALPGDGDDHPIDRFIQRGLESAGLQQTPPASPATTLRRLSFVLRGLPPSPEEIAKFDSASDFEALVDTFLDSPRFGERWARHWMDWVRYADSHGSEGDPNIPYSWRYRDYLIRALNEDVPYNQLAREHLAGDLLEKPRINRDLGLNESAIGPAHLRMVFHGFAPTDALDEQVRFTDDQINVVSKAFLGLTISCARCHNHKFDPISQRDFYGWYGIFASCPPASIAVNAPSADAESTRQSLAQQKEAIRAELALAWLEALPELEKQLANPDGAPLEEAIEGAQGLGDLLHPLRVSREKGNLDEVYQRWGERPPTSSATVAKAWDLSDPGTLASWCHDGGSVSQVAPNGAFAIATEGDAILTGIYPSGVYSHLLSDRDRGVLLSPRAFLHDEYDLWLELAGAGGSVMRYAVQNYPRNGTVYPVGRLNDGKWRWQRYGLDYWTGDHIHVEVTTAADQPILANTGAMRSWIGLRRVMLTPKGTPPPRDDYLFARPLLEHLAEAPTVARGYRMALQEAISRWQSGKLDEAEARFLGEALRVGLLPNQLDRLPRVRPLIEHYRKTESSLPEIVRAPGVLEKDAYDQEFFERGNHKTPKAPVPRHFLDAIDGDPYATGRSGRLALANDLFRPDNPLTDRVIVNRIWHHVFGEGLVRTPDNFGRLGQQPSHPELLDYLATWFRAEGYSIKKLIRFLVTSTTWKAESTPPENSRSMDPDNRLLSHAHVRRLEAEAIRDTLLATSGRLDQAAMYGAPVGGDSNRRSVYLRVKRNDLDPFLSTFDAPVPASTKGRRDVTNVPGQSLTLLNDHFVIRTAKEWAESLDNVPESERIQTMFLQSLGRRPQAEEAERARQFLGDSLEDERAIAEQRAQLQERERAIRAKQRQLDESTKGRVLADRTQSKETTPSSVLPEPVASWDFESDLRDQVGNHHGKAHGSARVENGYLLLDGQEGSYVSTSPLGLSLRAKTLEAWVRLSNLRQRGGGAISVQTLDGIHFDAIVFAEQEKRRWLAGSDGYARTESFQGPEESDAKDAFIHVAIVYAEDGTVTGYRQGVPYGKPYRSEGVLAFSKGRSQILFGNRHGEPVGNHMLQGHIDRAALYDRALSAEEIAASASGDANYVSRKQQLARMTEAEKAEESRLEAERQTISEQLAALESQDSGPRGWADLAHAIFNLKEFIYIR